MIPMLSGTAFPGHSEHPAPFQDQDHALDHDVDPGDSGRHSVPSSHLKALVSGAPQTGEAVHSRPLLQEGGADNGGEVDSHPHGEGDGEHRIEAGEHKPGEASLHECCATLSQLTVWARRLMTISMKMRMMMETTMTGTMMTTTRMVLTMTIWTTCSAQLLCSRAPSPLTQEAQTQSARQDGKRWLL